MQANRKTRENLVLPPFKATDGHNNSVWARARLCRLHGLHCHEARELVDAWITANCHNFTRAIPSHEVEQQIRNAYSYVGTPPEDAPKKAKAPKAERTPGGDIKLTDFIEKSFADFGVNELKLEHCSSYELNTLPLTFLETLFGNVGGMKSSPLWVCLGKTTNGMRTCKLEDLKRREHHGESFKGYQFVVPNPMSKETGTTMDGRESSWRCRDNAILEKDRIFHIVEYDLDRKGVPVPKDVQARRLWCLNIFFQDSLCLVVDSGGKSLQGWFHTKWMKQEDKALFWKLALATGADPAGERPEQFFRMPNALRAPKESGGAFVKQEVLFFSPYGGRRAK